MDTPPSFKLKKSTVILLFILGPTSLLVTFMAEGSTAHGLGVALFNSFFITLVTVIVARLIFFFSKKPAGLLPNIFMFVTFFSALPWSDFVDLSDANREVMADSNVEVAGPTEEQFNLFLAEALSISNNELLEPDEVKRRADILKADVHQRLKVHEDHYMVIAAGAMIDWVFEFDSFMDDYEALALHTHSGVFDSIGKANINDMLEVATEYETRTRQYKEFKTMDSLVTKIEASLKGLKFKEKSEFLAGMRESADAASLNHSLRKELSARSSHAEALLDAINLLSSNRSAWTGGGGLVFYSNALKEKFNRYYDKMVEAEREIYQ